MAASAGARARDNNVNLKELFGEEVTNLERAFAEGDPDKLHDAIEELVDKVEVFEESALLPGIARSDLKYARAVPEWTNLRQQYQAAIIEADEWLLKEYPEREPRPKLLHLKKLPAHLENPEKAKKGKPRSRKTSAGTGQNQPNQKEVTEVDEDKATAITVREPFESRQSSRGFSVHSAHTVKTGGGSLFLAELNLDTMTAKRAFQVASLQRDTVAYQLAKVVKDPSATNVDRLREAFVLGSITKDKLKTWIASTELDDNYELLRKTMVEFNGVLQEASDALDQHGKSMEGYEEEGFQRPENVQGWVDASHPPRQGKEAVTKQKTQNSRPKTNQQQQEVGKSTGNNPQPNRDKAPPVNNGNNADAGGEGDPGDPSSSSSSDDSDGDNGGDDRKKPPVRRDDNKANPKRDKTLGSFEVFPTDLMRDARPITVQLTMPPITMDPAMGAYSREFHENCRAEILKEAIPVFSGEIHLFATWRDAVYRYINTALSLPVSARLQVIKSKLTGDAAQLAKTITPLTIGPLHALLDLMQKEYGNPYVAMEYQLQQLRSLKKPEKFGYKGWRDFTLVIRQAMDACDLAGHSINEDRPILQHLLGQLPRNWYQHFLKTYEPKDRKLRTLLFVLDNYTNLEREEELWVAKQTRTKPENRQQQNNPKTGKADKDSKATTSAKSYATVVKTASVDKSEGKEELPKPSCPMCDTNDHQLAACPDFLALTVDERWTVVKTHKPHHPCLTFHERNQCSWPKEEQVCPVEGCGRYHNELLHNDRPPGGGPQRNRNKGRKDRNNRPANQPRQGNHNRG